VKSIFDSVVGAISSLKSATETSQRVKQLGETIGIAKGDIEEFRAASIRFGDTQGTIVGNIEKFGKEYVSTIPGQFHLGLRRMNISVLDAFGKMKPFRTILDEVADAAAKMPKKSPETYLKFREWYGFDKYATDMMQQGSAALREGRRKDVMTGVAKSDWQISMEAEAYQEFVTVLRVAGNVASLAGVGLWKLAKALTLFTPSGGLVTTAWQANNLLSRSGKESEQVKVTPQSVQQFRKDRWAPEAMGGGFKLEQMNVNVRVDKDGRATASVDGVKPNRVTTNAGSLKMVQ
jgi:hypothetical protein